MLNVTNENLSVSMMNINTSIPMSTVTVTEHNCNTEITSIECIIPQGQWSSG